MTIRLAFYLSSGCMGCEMAIVDGLAEVYVELSQHEIVWSAPLFSTSKYSDLESLPDKYIDVAIVEGGINSEENERVVRLLRKKSKKLVALGTCAVHGGIPSLSSFHSVAEIFDEVYGERHPSRQVVVEGKYSLTLPEITPQRAVSSAVKVDHYLPGCPPKVEAIERLISSLDSLEDEWLISGDSVCTRCPRSPAREGRGFRKIESVRRFSGDAVDAEGCFLEHGYLCFGFVIAGDCDADCPKASVPCRGCYGPLPNVEDVGGKVIDSLTPLLNDESAEQLISEYPELSKLLYLYRPSALRE
ncbi:MAG: F420-nonreducing hydrogenase [Archaeoglobi archaeon]|nr:F420-nonreducing hydrogenase [Archaeoglobi archaeon]